MGISSRKTGNIGEDFICEKLLEKGYNILARNYTIKGGEIDIIASKDDIIAFVEVKTRKINSLSSGYDAVDSKKIKRIIKTAEDYIWKNGVELQPRYDVAVVIHNNGKIWNFDYIENAYDVSDFNNIF